MAKPKTLQDYLEQWIAKLDGDFVLAIEVAKFCEHYSKKYPHQWKEWVAEYDQLIVSELMRNVLQAERTRAKRQGRNRGTTTPTDEELSDWLVVDYAIDDDDTRRFMRDMTAADLRYVAGTYDTRAKANLFEAAFMRALAKRVGSKTVGDVFTNDQIIDLRERIDGAAQHA